MSQESRTPARSARRGDSSVRAPGSVAKGVLVPTVVVAAIAFLVHLCASFGLFALGPKWITPLLVGGIAALASGVAWRRAAAGTAAGLALAVAVARPWFIGQLAAGMGGFVVSAGLFVLLGSAAAGIVAYVLGRAPRREGAERVGAFLLVAAIVGGMWVTTGVVNSGVFASPGAESLNQILSVRPELGNTPEDHDYFLRVFYDVHDGQDYYDSLLKVFEADPNSPGMPPGVTGYEPPTLYWLWLVLPRDGAAIPWAFLVFATLAVASAFSVGAQLTEPRVAVLGALIVAVAFLLLATTTWVTFGDGWAMALALAGVALFIASIRRDSRRLLWAAVAVFLAGAAVRELMVYPMMLAAASALLLPRGERWRQAVPWLVGLACFGMLYAAHVIAIDGRVSHKVGYGVWLQGGWDHLTATLQFFGQYFGAKPWLVPLLVLVGLAGAVTLRSSQIRLCAFLSVVIAAPLAVFLFVGNGGFETSTGAVAGYWGVDVVPIALALVPVALDRAMNAVGMTAQEAPSS